MTIEFLALQPNKSGEFIVEIETDLISAMNHWRLYQTPQRNPNEAILELLKKALVAEGYFLDEALSVQSSDEWTDAFRQIIAASRCVKAS